MDDEPYQYSSQWHPTPGEQVRLKYRDGVYIVLEVLTIPRLARVRPVTEHRSMGPFDFSELLPFDGYE